MMSNLLKGVFVWLALATQSYGQENNEQSIEVGKHVASNMDAMSMILSLLMVLAVIVISAMVLKRFQNVQQYGGGLKVVSSLHLGAKEKLVVVQAGEKQLVLGVTSQQITLIETLETPLDLPDIKRPELATTLSKILKNKVVKNYDKQE